MTTFTKLHIKNNSTKLLICFNDMSFVGEGDKFESYRTLTNLFIGFDFLFIKDVAKYYWYLTVMDELIIYVIDVCKSYSDVYSLANSSGTIPLLNIMPHIGNFKVGVVINGQNSLSNSVQKLVKPYTDCAVFDPTLFEFDDKYLSPLDNLPDGDYKLYFFYNLKNSDKIYCENVMKYEKSNIIITTFNKQCCHSKFIHDVMRNTDFLNNLLKYFV